MRGDQGHHAMEEGEGKCMFFQETAPTLFPQCLSVICAALPHHCGRPEDNFIGHHRPIFF